MERVTRGDVCLVAGGPDYSGKPRPAIVVQDDRFDLTSSLTICPLTSNPTEAPLLRPELAPSERNGLRAPCRMMIDKLTTVRRTKIGARIGRLDDADISRMNRAMVVFLGLAG